jgi:hypothetical protein
MRATGIGSENNSRPRPDDSRCPLLLIGVPIVGGRPFNGLCSDWDVRTIDFERCSVIEHGDPCVVASGEDPSGDRIVGQLQSRRWRGEGSCSLDDPVFGGLKVNPSSGHQRRNHIGEVGGLNECHTGAAWLLCGQRRVGGVFDRRTQTVGRSGPAACRRCGHGRHENELECPKGRTGMTHSVKVAARTSRGAAVER